MVVTRSNFEGPPNEPADNIGLGLEHIKSRRLDLVKDSLTLAQFSEEAYRTARDKGWWLYTRTFGDAISLIHSELSKALEEHRDGHKLTEVRINDKLYVNPASDDFEEIDYLAQNGYKPEGVGIELADVLIRIFDLAGKEGLDLDSLVRAKMLFNRTRPYRHGGKLL